MVKHRLEDYVLQCKYRNYCWELMHSYMSVLQGGGSMCYIKYSA